MAEKRMISKVISISKKFNIRLDDHFSRLLYLMLIPHSDDFGRLTGDSFKLKALILPMMKGVDEETVERSLMKLHNAELINWYEVSGEQYVQIINFDDHQQGLHKRTRSKIPDPPEHSRNFPELPSERRKEGNRTELKGTEENRTEGTEGIAPAPVSESIKDSLYNLVKQCNIKNYTIYDLDIMYSFIKVVDIEVIEAAIKKATNKDHINYAINTLKGFIAEGKTKKEHLTPKITPGTPKYQATTGKPKLGVVKDDGQSQPVSQEEMERMIERARERKERGTG